MMAFQFVTFLPPFRLYVLSFRLESPKKYHCLAALADHCLGAAGASNWPSDQSHHWYVASSVFKRGTTLTKSATHSGTPRTVTAGFSMVELVMSICVMLILTAMAIPALMRSLRTYQLNSAAASVSDLLKFTRFEAVRQNKKVSFLLKPANATDWIAWTGLSTDTAPAPTEKQFPIAGFATLVTSGLSGPNIAGSGALNVLSGSTCTPSCFAFDARGAVSPLNAYVLYIGGINNADTSYRAVVLLPSGSVQVWSAPAGGPWHQVN